MGLAVVSVASGGLPVVEATTGTPVTEATNGRGVPVTKVVGKPGMPVVFETIGVAPSGPPFSTVKLLLGFNGANDATGAPGMTDEGSAARGNATVNGGARIQTAQSVFGGSSAFFEGFNAWLTYPDHADWDLSNQPFTIEFRLRHQNSAGIPYIMCQWEGATRGWAIYMNVGVLTFNVSTNGTDNIVVMTGSTLAINTWYAICVEFDGIKYRMYVNGVMVGSSTTLRTIVNSPLALAIGATAAGGSYLFGHIDELRFTKGVARYASDGGYTVATSAFPRS